MSQVFVSYSHNDIEYVEKLEKKLISEGFDVWRDRHSIDFGSQWPTEMQEALDNCRAFILIASGNSFHSSPVQDEISRAKRKRKKIFPLLLEGDAWLTIESTQYVDVKDNSLPPERFYENLREVVRSTKSLHPDKTDTLLNINWKAYFDKLLESQRIISALAIDPFIELQTKTKESLEKETKEFLKTDRNGVLAIIGDALSGKTSFMGRLIAEIASNNLQEIEDGEDLQPPTSWIPIYISLRGKKADNFDTLYDLLPNKVKMWTNTTKEKAPKFIFGIPETKWLIYLDGLDEIWLDKDRTDTLKYLHKFLDDFNSTQMKIILTSRPWVGLYSEEDTQILEVAHLNPTQMEIYLISFINPDLTRIKNLSSYFDPINRVFMKKENGKDKKTELQQICSLPGYLSEFVKELPSSSNVSEVEYSKEKLEEKNEIEKSVAEENKYSLTSLSIINNMNELILTEPMVEGDSNRKSLEKGEEIEFEKEDKTEDKTEDKDKTEDIRVGVVVSNMYLKVWEREERRRSEDRQDLFEKTCELAAYIDGKMKTFTLSKALDVLPDKKDMNWILDLGIIRKEKKRYSFYQPLTAVSFATEYLRDYYLGEAFGKIREKKKKISNNFSDDFKRSVETMFESIEDVPIQHEEDVSSLKTTLNEIIKIAINLPRSIIKRR